MRATASPGGHLRPRRGIRRFAPPAVVVCAAALVSFGVCASAGAELPRYECPPTVADCTTVMGGWVDVPEQHWPTPGLAVDQVSCPRGRIPVGFSYEGGDTFLGVYVEIWQNSPNWRNAWNPVAIETVWFSMRNWGQARAIRDRIGCAPVAEAASAARDRPRITQTEPFWSARLRPSQSRSYTHRCPAGTRFVTGDATVEFFTDRAPSQTQLDAVAWSMARNGNGVTVKVRTSAKLHSHHAALRTYLFCKPT